MSSNSWRKPTQPKCPRAQTIYIITHYSCLQTGRLQSSHNWLYRVLSHGNWKTIVDDEFDPHICYEFPSSKGVVLSRNINWASEWEFLRNDVPLSHRPQAQPGDFQTLLLSCPNLTSKMICTFNEASFVPRLIIYISSSFAFQL